MKKKRINNTTFLLLITIALFIVMYTVGILKYGDKGFDKLQTFLNLLINNAGLIVITAGMTMVMIVGGIDISVGSLTALTCMLLANAMENQGVGAIPAVIIALVAGTAFGLVQGYLISFLKIQPFIVTLAGMFFARGMTATISTNMISIKNEMFLSWAQAKIYLPFGGYVSKKGVYNAAYIFPSVLVTLLVLLLVFIILRFTKFGRSLYAVGGNEQSALLMGINVRRTKLITYTLNGFLCSLGGFLFCLNSCAGFVEQAKGLEMDSIASAVIGGTHLTGGVGNVIGSLFGVIIKGTIETLITTQGTLSSWWTRITIAALLCIFIVLQSVLSSRKKT